MPGKNYSQMHVIKKTSLCSIFYLASLGLGLLGCCTLTACSSDKPPPPASQINGYPVSTSAGVVIAPMRLTAIQEVATSLGAQSGLAWASVHINNMLVNEQRDLDQTFNFQMLLLDHNVLPPVLLEGRNALNLDNPETIRLADQVFRIESPPRFVTTAPHWREYLWMNYAYPDKPSSTLIPRDEEERKVWNECAIKGWEDGIRQANLIFEVNMGRLKRDYNGMILYRTLLAQHMVTAPFVAKTELGVTGNANEMRINDQVLRITATSRLVPNSDKWRSVVVPGTPDAVKKQGIEGTTTLE